MAIPGDPLLPPRQFLNDHLGVRAFERGEPIAHHVPLEIHLQLSSTCNLDCVMCVEHLHPPEARRQRRLEFLPREVFDRLEERVLPATSELMLGVGGEALLCPDFFDYAERAHRLGVRNRVLTNGTKITSDEVAEQLVRYLSSIAISIDGATAPTYERFRRGASFAAVMEGIDRINRYRLALPAGERPELGFCFVMMRDNVHELPAFVELASRRHADRVFAAHVVPLTPEGREQSLFEERERSDRLVGEAKERAEELGVEIVLPRPFGEVAEETPEVSGTPPADLDRPEAAAGRRAPGQVACHMPTLGLYVLVDGRVYPCGHPLVHQQTPLGDLTVSSFAEIWNGREFRNLRAAHAAGDPPPVCRNCSLLHNPPPKLEDPSVLEGEGAGLVTPFGESDLVPLNASSGSLADLDPRVQASLGESLRELTEEQRRLSAEIETWRATSGVTPGELEELRARLADLEGVREHLTAHADNLEAEREHLVGHLANLERILARTHAGAAYRWFGKVKGLLRPGALPDQE